MFLNKVYSHFFMKDSFVNDPELDHQNPEKQM